MNDNYVIRTMSRGELDTVIEWAAEEGWNPGLHDADAFFAADSSGFYIGLLGGEPIASLSVVRYGPEYAFMGFYIVRPAVRGKGYGLKLWQYALEHTQATNLGLDGVIDQQDNYRRSGFRLAHRNIRYETTASVMIQSWHSGTGAVSDEELESIVAYDRGIFLAPRTDFLKRWLRLPGSQVVCLTDSVSLRITGYGAVRAARDGYRIGPLFAETERAASVILAELIGKVPIGGRVSMDVPMANEVALKLATERGMTPAFETARMYTQSTPQMAVDKVFGITSLELG